MENVTFLALGAGVWGKGKTLDVAVRNMNDQGWDKKSLIIYVSDDPEIRISGDGCITFHPPLSYQEIYRSHKGWRYGIAE